MTAEAISLKGGIFFDVLSIVMDALYPNAALPGQTFPPFGGSELFDFTLKIPDICSMNRYAGVEKIECPTVS